MAVRDRARGGLGTAAARPDGISKVLGDFAFSSDLHVDGMLWGRTLRSPHPHARIRTLDVTPALAIAGVSAVITADDVPGELHYGLISADQPVFARDVVRFVGEPIAAVAADHPETARRALEAIVVEYDVLTPLVDAEAAAGWEPIHPDGNVIRSVVIRRGDAAATGDVVVEGTYEIGMQDQAFLGPESGLAIPAEDGSIDLHVATQWTHSDRDQVAACLAMPTNMIRLHLAGVGGAFGAREDVSMQVHASLLAKVARRPVKMSYLRDESFVGHVHRHPARFWMRHHADRDGTLRRVEVRTTFDGGAYASSSMAVIGNAARFSVGPYRVESVDIEATAVRTNNPPCGAMRGFGSVQVCFAHESQMDLLAAELDMDPVELRLHNALRTGDRLPTGQVLRGAAPVAECIQAAMAHPLPDGSPDEVLARPGGAGRTSTATEIRRGTGLAVGIKNLMYSEGENDTASATVRLADGIATVKSAAAEVGQGFVTIAQQIVREVLGVEEVVFHSASTDEVGSAGSTSASRQTWMSGGAVAQASRLIASAVCQAVALRDGLDPEEVVLDGTTVVTPSGRVPLADAVPDQPIEIATTFHHAPTEPLDEDGQGNADVSFAFAAHRAVVDVDPDLGLVRVVQITTGQDVGRVLHPTQLLGQIEGGTVQGMGLAVMEEIVVQDGVVKNPSFTDYLLPTTLDAPEILATFIEEPEPDAPFGAKGVGEPPIISSGPAVVAAIRDATGASLHRMPVRPADVALS